MCGIAGFIETQGGDRSALAEMVGRMADRLSHRGPDDRGVWIDEQFGIGLGHRRLSILDLSPLGHQPMESPCGRYVCIFNGEIYNFRELRAELDRNGHVFRGHSDTEVLLAAIREWGLQEALERCNGMFAFALWDRLTVSLSLARDRLGEKPLYYGWCGQTFLFGSELKAFAAHPSFHPTIDRDALALYLRYSFIPAPYTIYQGIAKLPPGNSMTINQPQPGQMPEPVPYWRAKEAAEQGVTKPYEGTQESALDDLDSLLRQSVVQRMVADVPLGAFLSGGIDSSMVVALMQAQSSRPVKTFSIGFYEQGYDEAKYAAAVARHLGTDHTELYVTSKQAMDVIPALPQMYDEPFSDASQIPTHLVSSLARQHVTVSLSGDGGDELFAGYERYFYGGGIWDRTRKVPWFIKQPLAVGMTALSPGQWNRLYHALHGLLPERLRVRNPGSKMHKLAHVFRADSQEALYLSLLSHWDEPTAVVKGASEPPTVITDRAQWAQLPDFMPRMMFWDLMSYLPDDILTKVDRASMAVGLEARVPFLDHHLVEFAHRLPLAMKVKNGRGKWILRELLARYVPMPLVDRPKMGFGVPIGAWLRGPLREWAETLLAEERLKNDGFFHPAPIRQKWTEHLAGACDWQYHLWDALMFQAWLDAQSA